MLLDECCQKSKSYKQLPNSSIIIKKSLGHDNCAVEILYPDDFAWNMNLVEGTKWGHRLLILL